jgi:hypothetical protein
MTLHPMGNVQSLSHAPAADPESVWAHDDDGAHPERVSAVDAVVLRG